MQRSIAVLLVIFFCEACRGQIAGGGPGVGGGGSSNDIEATVIPLTATDVPMGTEVRMRLDHEPVPNPTYSWFHQCFDKAKWTQPEWTSKFHDDCVGTPAELLYEGRVHSSDNGVTRNGADSQLFIFHEPNQATTSIGGLLPYQIPFQYDPPRVQQQIMSTTLKWNGQPLGPCATLCYRERVSVIVKRPFGFGPLGKLKFRHVNWVPSYCTQEFYGWAQNPSEVTLNWSSPSLYDRNWIYWSFPMMKRLQSIPTGTVIAERQHQYQFDGSRCNGTLWGPYVYEVWLDLVVEQATDANGNPLAIPNTVPPRYFKAAVWKVR